MVMRKFTDSEGNEIEVDDDVSLLGPVPAQSPESPRDTRYQPIHYDHTGGPAVPPAPVDPHSLNPQPQPPKSGYGNGETKGTVDDEEWKQKHFGDGNYGGGKP